MGHVLFLRKGATHTAPGKVLPYGYQKLQYIQSSGTQWLNTGVQPTVNTKFSFGVYMLEKTGDCIVGNFLNDNNDYRIFNYEGTIYWDFKDSRLIGETGSFSINEYLEFECGNYYVNKNGQRVLTGSNITAFTADANIFVFSKDGSSTGCSGKLYFLKIYDGESLIRDYVPCISPAGAVGLYDLVDGKFYGNSGTGVFYAGPPVVTLPEGYTQLMYLESSGTQYINTGFTPNQDARIQLDCERTAANATDHFFGVRTGNSASSAFAFYIYNSGWRWAYNNATASGTGPDIGRYFIDANKNVTTINGDTTLTGTYASFTAAAAAPLFAMLSVPSGFSYGSFRLYTCRIYNNGLMVRNFIPCRNASGTIGLYDLVNGQFYTNAGTGTFTAGEVE